MHVGKHMCGVFILSFLCFSCAEKPTLENCFVTTIKVASIADGSSDNIVLTASYGEDFYIADGLKKGVDAAALNHKLQGEKIEIYVPKLIMGHSKNVAQIVLNDTIVYTEFTPLDE